MASFTLISLHLPDYLLFSLKSYLEGRTLRCTWMTLPPPKNLTPPVFLQVLYYPLHYFPFTFLTCRVLHTLSSPYTQTTLSFYLSVLVCWNYLLHTQSHCTNLTQIFSPHGNSNYIPTKLKQFYFPSAPSQTFFKSITPGQYTIYTLY
jgi:hypothetical protein